MVRACSVFLTCSKRFLVDLYVRMIVLCSIMYLSCIINKHTYLSVL